MDESLNTTAIVASLRTTRDSIEKMSPPFWARTGHLQTLLGHLLPSEKVMERGVSLTIDLESKFEQIHTTYLAGNTETVVYLFHGLGGSADAAYMQRTALQARALGHHVFLNNHRGCGMGVGLASEPYHSGRADDLSRVIAFGREKFPLYTHVAIGFSLSANALLLLAAGVGASVLPDSAIAVNGPINLDRASRLLQHGLNKIYDWRFVRELERYIKSNRPQDEVDFSLVKDLRDFDQRYTAPLGGFRDRDDYYQTCSAKQYLTKIKIPTVIIAAEDDPFISIIDYEEASYSDLAVCHFEKHGGHMGYLTRNSSGFERWLDGALYEYIQVLQKV